MRLKSTTSASTGQIVRRDVRITGSRIRPVMFATASTPDSASTIRTNDCQRSHGPCIEGCPIEALSSPLGTNRKHRRAISNEAASAPIAITSASRPALRAPNQLTTPTTRITAIDAHSTKCSGTPR